MPIEQQHVVIVGGSSGVGLATARKLLASGAKVTVAGREPAKLAATNSAETSGPRRSTQPTSSRSAISSSVSAASTISCSR
jgi:NAD(P)-dependent dehydrogenase (short-subunit alcohol dehydrogenase family)